MGEGKRHHSFIGHRAANGEGDVKWFALDVNHLESGLEFVRENRFPRVSFTFGLDTKKVPKLDLRVLMELPFLEGLDLACKIASTAELAPLYSLGNLKELWLRTSLPNLDLQYFPHLQALLAGNNKFRGGRFLKELKHIVIEYYTNELSPELCAMSNLRDIELRFCNAEFLEDFDQYPSVQTLMLRCPQKLVRVDEVASSKSLKSFNLERSSRLLLRDLGALAKSETIESIWILQKEIASCEFVRHMPRLSSFYCNAAIGDNDLQPILDSKSLTDVRISPMKKSYTPRIEYNRLTGLLNLPK